MLLQGYPPAFHITLPLIFILHKNCCLLHISVGLKKLVYFIVSKENQEEISFSIALLLSLKFTFLFILITHATFHITSSNIVQVCQVWT